MSFVYPWLVAIMVIPFGIFAFLVLTNREGVARIFDAQMLRRLRVDGDVLPLRVRNTILLLAILLMILALGRPVIPHADRTVSLKGLTAMVALDISGSMRSRDLYPNRLEFAKRKIAQLLDAMPGDEIALSAFAQAAFMLAPFTTDKATLKQILEGVDESYINLSSTNFSALGDLAASFLATKPHRILVVFTDGGDAQALEGFRTILEDANITLYSVLIGTTKGAPVLDANNRPLKDARGHIAITQRNDALGTVAKATGGISVIAANGKGDMHQLARTIHARHGARKQGSITIKDQTELFIYFLAGATVLLLLGLISLPRNPLRLRRRSRR
jgi:Ca-activated chloride channel family protein